ncbi:NAD-dependent epimerase/dehydratase family protein [Micromonospora sp. NPDC050397]|uniref:NAD-dependent epimerase/dehydratase family protein n=1 Tax=Micromonospora sp. NPDC050397 TaxID=3364279 RepID=UPI00384E5CA5
MSRILLTGASGFVGGAVLRALRRAPGDHSIRLLTHRTPLPGPTGEIEVVPADLARPRSLGGICDGVDTLVHLAARIGGDERSCQQVNHHGTAALVAEARRAGVTRILYLSTAAVYGDGVYRGLAEDEVPPTPVSPTSRSRLDAERVVRAADGTVLRPMFVTGKADAWFRPTLLGLLAALGNWVDEGEARLSTVDVDELARIVVAAATTRPLRAGAVYHANHPEPVRVRDLVGAAGDFVPPSGSVSLAEAEQILPPPFTRRQLHLLFSDQWFDNSRLWRDLDLTPDPGR